MRLMGDAFNVSEWIDADGNPVELRPEAVEQRLRSDGTESDVARFGATWIVKSAGNQNPIVLKTGTGGDEWSPNFFTADFSRTTKLPDLQYFRGSIEFIRPIEAFILDQDNEHTLRVRRRQEARESRRDQPTILRWFHYLADELVISLGGISHCLRTPAFKVEPFCEGVLFQLTADPFDADNPKHQEIQLGAMQHLGLIQ